MPTAHGEQTGLPFALHPQSPMESLDPAPPRVWRALAVNVASVVAVALASAVCIGGAVLASLWRGGAIAW